MSVTHQGYLTYAQTGNPKPTSKAGNSVPDNFPDESSLVGVTADTYTFYHNEGYTLVLSASWNDHYESLKVGDYFSDIVAEEALEKYLQQLAEKVKVRKEAGLRVTTRITALLDAAAAQLGDPVVTSLAQWRSEGDSIEEIKPKLIALMDSQEDSFATLDSIMASVSEKLEAGSLQRGMLALLNPANSSQIPEAFQPIYNQAIDLVAEEIAKYY